MPIQMTAPMSTGTTATHLGNNDGEEEDNNT